MSSSFTTNPRKLLTLLRDCHEGTIQLPDFQRSWVWDEDRICSLIASISQSFPVGALMTLETGGDVEFKPRPIEGAPTAAETTKPKSLILDGQQRMTSLYQVALRGQVVRTVTSKKKTVERWFYIDVEKALDPSISREEAIIGVPADRKLKSAESAAPVTLGSVESELAHLIYPVSRIFDWDSWSSAAMELAWSDPTLKPNFDAMRQFKKQVIEPFTDYQVPVIELSEGTTKEAVCLVFEKVNTGGKALDAFELITAMYAAHGHELRKDWYGKGDMEGRHARLTQTLRYGGQDGGILQNVSNTDFLHVISLFHTRDRRLAAQAEGKKGKDLPQVIGSRAALLNLPLSAYLQYEQKAEEGFARAAKFLHMLHIYRIYDLPYQSQVIPLAAVLAEIGDHWEHAEKREKLVQWYWTGVFGELYGSTIDTRIARDYQELPLWLDGGPEPQTVSETAFNPDRLKTMRARLSAAYKGVNALLMLEGCKDLRSGQTFDNTVFFGESVDIHHIFPQDWCKKQGIDKQIYDSIINKTPLSSRTNRIVGGHAPSVYLANLQAGGSDEPPIQESHLDARLASHALDVGLLRADDFESFMADRQTRLVALIEQAMGKSAMRKNDSEIDAELDELAEEASKTLF
ncbi:MULTISPECIES: DUF262 domain-containing protein [Paenarthrobacter]|uniref:DUF262 domain-containing protein n=1 Tax=Paenarthrobacter ureafaciens TaxID=37931 RepID=A0AAX3EPQ8_PAEUR|nr:MULTISPECIES: DUF262 domain-containing protein [Paenarthrobacter]NKR13459.1 hypothetical protein [Arthrobacter sp. M5]NKR18561.1 hypothetical protein [Arthrobacter sp. M6]MCX8455145.1 DUF262 domain-containing protein [Paenarthrobacter ureafaciens]MCY0974559.1 DUF262 domain-containing protein [Paenarthrobacter ureafaciens]MDO5866939.1 DUF262 domain-containing protein [Paenarthrobacter sp. SD-2]